MTTYELILLFWNMTPDGGSSFWVNLGDGWWAGAIF